MEMGDMERSVFELHDRRLNEFEVRFNQSTRDFTEIKDALKQLAERLNEGVAKTQQRLLQENGEIRLEIQGLKHAIEIDVLKMNDKIDTVHKGLIDKIEPLEDSNRHMTRVYVWGIVGGVVLGIIGFLTTKFMEKAFVKAEAPIVGNIAKRVDK